MISIYVPQVDTFPGSKNEKEDIYDGFIEAAGGECVGGGRE